MSRRRQPNESGAATVEFALLAPVLALFLFGMIEFGAVFNNFNGLRQATRDGARAAAVNAPGTNYSCNIVGGVPRSDQSLVCLIKNRTGLSDDVNLRVKILLSAATTNPSPGDEIVVCTQYGITSITGFAAPFVSNKTMTSRVAMRAEQTSGLVSAAEDSLPQSSWAFCTL
jgi:Flp pilus assembly pilin Flp